MLRPAYLAARAAVLVHPAGERRDEEACQGAKTRMQSGATGERRTFNLLIRGDTQSAGWLGGCEFDSRGVTEGRRDDADGQPVRALRQTGRLVRWVGKGTVS